MIMLIYILLVYLDPSLSYYVHTTCTLWIHELFSRAIYMLYVSTVDSHWH